MTSPAIEITDLTRSFAAGSGPVHAVRGIDLTIAPGEVVALLGPNGAGKTTTLDMVLGLVPASGGAVQVLGRAPRQAVREGKVSAVLQTGGLLADLTVAETVRFVASAFREHADPADVLDRAGIADLADRRVSKCSGGQQQRLRFALALLPDPEVLILDEPTAGMDVTARREFWDTMHAEAARGRTVVFATHYLEEADSFAQRIVMMVGGRIVADGPTEEIRARVTGRVVSAVVDDAQAAVARLGEMGAQVEVVRGRIRARGTDSDAYAKALLNDLSGRELEVVSGSLDEVFVALTDNPNGIEGAAR